MARPCTTCGALCCKYFCFQIDEPDDYSEFEDIRWYICHEGVTVHIDEDGDWFIQIMNPCLKLDSNDRCKIYDDRPLLCRHYGDTCEASGTDYGYQEEFLTPEQLDAYARKTLGADEYDREMLKCRAKAEGVTQTAMRAKLVTMGRLVAPKKAKRNAKKGS